MIKFEEFLSSQSEVVQSRFEDEKKSMEEILARQNKAIRDHYAAEIEENQNTGHYNSMLGFGLIAAVAPNYYFDTGMSPRIADILFEGEVC